MKKELFEYKINNDDTEVSENVINQLNDRLKADFSNLPESISDEVKEKLQELLGITESVATASGSAFE